MSNVDWLATRNQMIVQALYHIGVVPLGEDPTPEQQSVALFQLNSITKFLETKQLFLWNYSEETITLVNNQRSYGIVNNDAIGIDKAYYLTPTSQQVDMGIIDQPTYFGYSDKLTLTGVPDKVFFDRGNAVPTLYLYAIPNTALSSCPVSIQVRLARRLQDWDTAAGNAWPAWWVEPIIWRLAADLSYMFRVALPERDRIELKANNLMAEAFSDNWRTHDRGDVQFTPD